MAQQLLDGNNIYPIFEQMGGVTVSQRMEGNILFDVCFFQVFAYDSAQSFHAVASVGFFAVKQPDMRVFC